jgi:hypothetical protein
VAAAAAAAAGRQLSKSRHRHNHGQRTHAEEKEETHRGAVRVRCARPRALCPATVCRCCARPALLVVSARVGPGAGNRLLNAHLTSLSYTCVCPSLSFGVQSTARKSVPHRHSARHSSSPACPTSRPGNERIARKQGARALCQVALCSGKAVCSCVYVSPLCCFVSVGARLPAARLLAPPRPMPVPLACCDSTTMMHRA